MLAKQHSVVIASFEEQSKAKKVSSLLQDAGFLSNQIWLVTPGEQTKLHELMLDFQNMGMPEEEMHYFENEFQAGHSIVFVRHEGHYWQVVAILYEDSMQRYMKWSKNQEVAAQEPIVNKNVSPIHSRENEDLSQESKLPSWEKLLRDAGFDYLL